VLQKSDVENYVCFNMQQGRKMIKTTKEYFEGHTSTAELVEQEEGGLM